MLIGFWLGNLKEQTLGKTRRSWKMIIKYIFKEQKRMEWSGSFWLRIGSSGNKLLVP